MRLTYEPLALRHAAVFAALWNADAPLRRALFGEAAPRLLTAEAVYAQGKAWEAEKRGRCYAILCGGAPVGTIAERSLDGRTAGCGYWLRRELWNRGCMTQAFGWLLARLAREGYETATASIDRENVASLRLWQRYGASMKAEGAQCRVSLALARLRADFFVPEKH